eukprot:5172620-Amphidinium_carterae.4
MRYRGVVEAAHRTASLRCRTQLPYTSVSINEGAYAPHTDSNWGPTVVFAAGKYTKDELHLFAPVDEEGAVTGTELRCPERLSAEHWGALHRWGFPVSSCLSLLGLDLPLKHLPHPVILPVKGGHVLTRSKAVGSTDAIDVDPSVSGEHFYLEGRDVLARSKTVASACVGDATSSETCEHVVRSEGGRVLARSKIVDSACIGEADSSEIGECAPPLPGNLGKELTTAIASAGTKVGRKKGRTRRLQVTNSTRPVGRKRERCVSGSDKKRLTFQGLRFCWVL